MTGREVADYIIPRIMDVSNRRASQDFELDYDKKNFCGPISEDETVVLLQRRSRRIVNLEDIAKTLRKLKVKSPSSSNVNSRTTYSSLNVRVALFENASITEQISTAHCCRLFFGVMGAGQQWVSFMRRGSMLLSVGWQNWRGDYYAKYAKGAGVRFKEIKAARVLPKFDHPTVVKHFGKEELRNSDFRQNLIRKGDKQIMKYSDVIVNAADVAKAACQVFSCF